MAEPRYYILDGRHRYQAALWRQAPMTLRCDVITENTHGLRMIPIEQLAIDPHVQLGFSFQERRARKLAAEWDDRLVGVLVVVPIDSSMEVSDKATIKMGYDANRRGVRLLEHFLEDGLRGDVETLQIIKTCEKHGYSIGPRGHRNTANTIIEAVGVIRTMVRRVGIEGLDRILTMDERWYEEPGTTESLWLEALFLLVRDDYDERLTDKHWTLLKEIIPGDAMRKAIGETALRGHAGHGSVSSIAVTLVDNLRKKARLPKKRSRQAGESQSESALE